MKKPIDDSYHPPAPNFYENRGEVLATRANLPHWNKALTCCFVTFRLADSLPRAELLKQLEMRGVDLGSEATGTLEKGRDAFASDCFCTSDEDVASPFSGQPQWGSGVLAACKKEELFRARRNAPRPLFRSDGDVASPFRSDGDVASPSLQEEIQDCLDAGYGSCVLRDDACRQIVEDALWHFAGERYHLYAYVVMPNHAHVLFQPTEGRALSRIVADWKSFTAHKINELRGTDGVVWQKESFDTLVRSQRHFQTVISYIRKNDLTRAWVAYH